MTYYYSPDDMESNGRNKIMNQILIDLREEFKDAYHSKLIYAYGPETKLVPFDVKYVVICLWACVPDNKAHLHDEYVYLFQASELFAENPDLTKLLQNSLKDVNSTFTRKPSDPMYRKNHHNQAIRLLDEHIKNHAKTNVE